MVVAYGKTCLVPTVRYKSSPTTCAYFDDPSVLSMLFLDAGTHLTHGSRGVDSPLAFNISVVSQCSVA